MITFMDNSDKNQLEQSIDELKGDLINVNNTKADKTDLAKTNLYLDALYKLNRGQTYDVLQQESEAYSVDVPSGAKYVGIDKVGGKSVVFAQLVDEHDDSKAENGITWTYNEDGSVTANGTATAETTFRFRAQMPNTVKIVLAVGCPSGGSTSSYYINWTDNIVIESNINDFGYGAFKNVTATSIYLFAYCTIKSGTTVNELKFTPKMFDVTQQSVITTVDEFISRYPNWANEPYSEPTIISSQTDAVEVYRADKTLDKEISTNLPILRSAGSIHDSIEGGKLIRRVGAVDLGTLNWAKGGTHWFSSMIPNAKNNTETLCVYPRKTYGNAYASTDNCYAIGTASTGIFFRYVDSNDLTDFKNAISEVMLHYELAEPIVTDITIPTELTDWLTVEAGGSVTFHNTDDGKRLLIPNKLSFIRKLDEVSV